MPANETTTAMTCPKCQGSMRTYERNGVMVDQCGDCRGIFLDRGELERLIEAEDVHYGRSDGPPSGSADRSRDQGYQDQGYQDRDPRGGGHGGGHGGSSGGKHGGSSGDPSRRRRGSFLGDLLDFG